MSGIKHHLESIGTLAERTLGGLALVEQTAASAIGAVDRVTSGRGGDVVHALTLARSALKAIGKAAEMIRASARGLADGIDVEGVEHELKELQVALRDNDRAARAAIDAKFGTSDE